MTDVKVTFMLIFIFIVLFLDSTVVFVDDSQLIHRWFNMFDLILDIGAACKFVHCLSLKKF